MRAGRKRKAGVARTPSGQISRAGRSQVITIHPEALAARERELARDGIILKFDRTEGNRVVADRTARDRLSGYTLGKLLLLERQKAGSGISQEQFDAGEAYSRLVQMRRSMVDDSDALAVKPQSLQLKSKGEPSPPDPEKVADIRNKWNSCQFELRAVFLVHGQNVRRALDGVCLDGWTVSELTPSLMNSLRMGLSAIGRALR